MVGDENKPIPSFTDNWMDGSIDRLSLIRPVIRARNELNGLSEEKVRELANRLDALIKEWKLEQGVPFDEVFKTTVPSLSRRKWYPASIMSGVEIIQATQDHELFKSIAAYPKRIAVWLLKAADNKDYESVLSATVALDELYWKFESERLEKFRVLSGFELLTYHRQMIDDKRKQHKRQKTEEAIAIARLTAKCIWDIDEEQSSPPTSKKKILALIKMELKKADFHEYKNETVWRDWNICSMAPAEVKKSGRPSKK